LDALTSSLGSDERILYCCPPQYSNGYRHVLFQLLVGVGISVIIMGIMLGVAEVDSQVPLMLGVSAAGILFILLAFFVSVPYFYGFRVVTNFRAANVVVGTHFFRKPSISSFFFIPAFSQLLDRTPSRASLTHIARLVHDKSVEQVADVTFVSEKKTLKFLKVTNCYLLEESLESVVQQLSAERPIPLNFVPKAKETFLSDEVERKQKTAAKFFFYFFPFLVIGLMVGMAALMTVISVQNGTERTMVPFAFTLVVLGMCSLPGVRSLAGQMLTAWEEVDEGRSILFGHLRYSGV